MKQLVQKLHYKSRAPFFWALLMFLPSLFYLLAISFKNALYSLGILKEQQVGAKVICVGNLTTGGVGKTPIVCALANYLASKGRNVAVVSRGYGGKLDNKGVNVVKNYEKTLIQDAKECGDEPYLIAQNTFNAIVLTCRDRVAAAKEAIERFKAEVVILDDGFSNRKIKKDLNILVVDSEKRFGNNGLLPLGPLREPLWEIKRAHKLVVVQKNSTQTPKLDSWNKPVFTCKMVKDKYYNALSAETFAPQGRPKVFAFCAIGQPEQFYSYLQNDFEILATCEFQDHHSYCKKDIEKMLECAKSLGAQMFLTTEKDAVKLVGLFSHFKSLPLVVLKLKQELDLEGLLKDFAS